MREDWTECCFEDLLDYEQPTKYIVNTTANTKYTIPIIPYTDIFYEVPQVKKYVSASTSKDVVKAKVDSDTYTYDTAFTEVV